jgi:hypothetical protein
MMAVRYFGTNNSSKSYLRLLDAQLMESILDPYHKKILTAFNIVLTYYPGWPQNTQLWGKDLEENTVMIAAHSAELEAGNICICYKVNLTTEIIEDEYNSDLALLAKKGLLPIRTSDRW